MIKVFYFLMICLYILGILGGIGYSLYNNAYVIAVALVACGYMAFPMVKDYYNKLTN